MKNREIPFYKKYITHGNYNIKLDYIILIVAAFIIIFSLPGISVCSHYQSYAKYIWVPSLLIILSFILMISSSFRILKNLKNGKSVN